VDRESNLHCSLESERKRLDECSLMSALDLTGYGNFSQLMARSHIGGVVDICRYVREVLLISFTPTLSRRRRRSRNVPPFMYPTFAAISSMLALLVFKRCTARSTRRP
jgi:hypothetical protein